jgi:hypothetical protein
VYIAKSPKIGVKTGVRCDEKGKVLLPQALFPCEMPKKGGICVADKKNTVRKTVSLDQGLVDQCGMLFASAGADNFSEYVTMALKKYNDILISQTQSSLLTNEMRGAIRKELGPITSRLSKGLYRYGVLIDMLCQMLSYMQFAGGDEIMNQFHRRANARMGRTRGHIDLQGILDDTWEAYQQGECD